MNKMMIPFLYLITLSSVIHANPNNPTNGYCQSVDPSACGWNNSPDSWHTAIAFDKSNGRWGAYQSNMGERQAIALAYQWCQKHNVKTDHFLLNKQKKCTNHIILGGGIHDKNLAMVLVKGQKPNGEFDFNTRYGGGNEMKNAALRDCQQKLQNCTVEQENY